MRIEHSAFDSAHYGFAVGHLLLEPQTGDGFDAALAASHGRFRLVILRVERGDGFDDDLRARGLQPMDTLITSTLRDSPPVAAPPSGIQLEEMARVDQPDDIARIASLTSYTIDRSHLHADPMLPVEATRQLFAAWARNDVTGRAERTFIARRDGEIIGYLTALRRESTAVIDLVAVDRGARSLGVGSALVGAFITWVRRHDLAATVGTQEDNPALSVYRRAGFVPTAAHCTYHLWLT